MLSRDLIASVIKTFFEELDDVRDGRRDGDAASLYAGLYVSHFGQERDWFLRRSTEEITVFFAADPIHKLGMLAELMYRDSRTLTDAEIQGVMFRKIIGLYEQVDLLSMEFSMERMNRVQELKNLLAD